MASGLTPRSSPTSGDDDQVSSIARASLRLHALRNRLSERTNADDQREDILSDLLDAVIRRGMAAGALLTMERWAKRQPELLLAKPREAKGWWDAFQGRPELQDAHAGERVSWSVDVGDPPAREDCFSFCFSTNGRGVIALTGVRCPRPRELHKLRLFLSAEVEHLLVRDHIVKAAEPGGPLRDMADWTWLTLDAANEALEQIDAHSEGTPERLVAESSLRMKIQELCHYTHIDDGLAEVSSSLLVVTHQAHPGPLSQANVEALRDVFGWMRAIALSDEDSERCLDRLEEGGLDIFDAFGEDDSGLQHP